MIVLLDMEASSAISLSISVCHSMARFNWETMVTGEATAEETKLGCVEEIEASFSRPFTPNASYMGFWVGSERTLH